MTTRTSPRAPARRAATAKPAVRRPAAPKPSAAAVVAQYAPRGFRECGYMNLRILTRVIGNCYDDALKPCGLRAAQLALLWSVAAIEPAELGQLGVATFTDQTTLSRTVENLRKEGLVDVKAGADRRTRLVSLTALGRRKFAEAMPCWEAAQRRAEAMLPLEEVRKLSRQVRRAVRSAA